MDSSTSSPSSSPGSLSSKPTAEATSEANETDMAGDWQTTLVKAAKNLWYLRNFFIAFVLPLILLPLPLGVGGQVAGCAYVIIIMAIFWITEVIPIPVTSLMPIFLLPMMGILSARTVSATYMNDTSMLFVGGLIFAVAIERWDIHRRIALLVLMFVGSTPRWLMAGLMSVTWFLSMWISNTATTAMMLPIVQAVLQQLRESGDKLEDTQHYSNGHATNEMHELTPNRQGEIVDSDWKYDNGKSVPSNLEMSQVPVTLDHPVDRTHRQEEEEEDIKKKDADFNRLRVAMSLCVAYAANVGGIGCLTGTGPNLVLKGQADIVFERFGITSPITFATWLVYGLPLSFIVLVLLWIWLQIFFLRCNGMCDCFTKKGDPNKKEDLVKQVLRAEYRKLGPVKFVEWTIIILFSIVIVLWITREFDDVCGWGCLFHPGLVSDSTPSTLMCLLLFVLPSAVPRVFCLSKYGAEEGEKQMEPILDWKSVHEKMPWSLYLLLGGGFAIAKAAEESGLSAWVGSKLEVFSNLNPWLMLLILCYIIAMLTEVTSNTAIATLMMPILARLALNLSVNPLFFMFPAAIATSFAFCLPVATPPNAMVFSSGYVRVVDMVSAGFMMNIISVPVLIFATVTWGNAFFHFDVLPEAMANALNVTSGNTSAII